MTASAVPGGRRVQMIAIGPGLFLGSAYRLYNTGQRRCCSAPRLFGMIAYFPMRHELVLHPTTTVLALASDRVERR
jgi:L-asparagine transporter-like permease